MIGKDLYPIALRPLPEVHFLLSDYRQQHPDHQGTEDLLERDSLAQRTTHPLYPDQTYSQSTSQSICPLLAWAREDYKAASLA